MTPSTRLRDIGRDAVARRSRQEPGEHDPARHVPVVEVRDAVDEARDAGEIRPRAPRCPGALEPLHRASRSASIGAAYTTLGRVESAVHAGLRRRSCSSSARSRRTVAKSRALCAGARAGRRFAPPDRIYRSERMRYPSLPNRNTFGSGCAGRPLAWPEGVHCSVALSAARDESVRDTAPGARDRWCWRAPLRGWRS